MEKYCGLPIVGTKTWNSLLNQPVESLNEILCGDRNEKVISILTDFLYVVYVLLTDRQVE